MAHAYLDAEVSTDAMSKRAAARGSASVSVPAGRGGGRGTRTSSSATFVEHMIVDRVGRFYSGRSIGAIQSKPASKTTNANKKQTSKQKLASRVYNLSLDVAALRQQLQQLTLHRSLLQTRALYTQRDPDGSAFKTAVEYWNVFSRGCQASNPRQPAFLASVADHDLSLGLTGLGREVLLQQWVLYTDYFAIRRYKMHSVRVVATDDASGACVTRGEGVFCGTVTRKALEMVFPVVLRDPVLTQQLLGKEIVTPIAFVLHFNAEGKWVRHDGEADLFAALARALGDPIRAAAVMENAQVAEEGMVGPVEDIASHTAPLEPIERSARIKRSRFTVVDDQWEEDKGDYRDDGFSGGFVDMVEDKRPLHEHEIRVADGAGTLDTADHDETSPIFRGIWG